MSLPSVKVLVSGAVNGRFQEFFQKVAQLNAKSGPFEMCLCVGNFFQTSPSKVTSPLADLRNGTVKGKRTTNTQII